MAVNRQQLVKLLEQFIYEEVAKIDVDIYGICLTDGVLPSMKGLGGDISDIINEAVNNSLPSKSELIDDSDIEQVCYELKTAIIDELN